MEPLIWAEARWANNQPCPEPWHIDNFRGKGKWGRIVICQWCSHCLRWPLSVAMMVGQGKLSKHFARIKKILDTCKKSFKREVSTWRAISFNIIIRVLVSLLSKAQTSRVSSSFARQPIPTSSSFLRFLLVELMKLSKIFKILVIAGRGESDRHEAETEQESVEAGLHGPHVTVPCYHRLLFSVLVSLWHLWAW